MTTRALKLGAAGAVVDGYHRDTRGILDLGFPTFSPRELRSVIRALAVRSWTSVFR